MPVEEASRVEELIRNFDEVKPNAEWMDEYRSVAFGKAVTLPRVENGMLDPERNVPRVMADVDQVTMHGLDWPATVRYGAPSLGAALSYVGAYRRTDAVRWQQFPDTTGLRTMLWRDALGGLAAVGAATLINRQIDKQFFSAQATDVGSCIADLAVSPIVASLRMNPFAKTLALVSVHTAGKLADGLTQHRALYQGPGAFGASMESAFNLDVRKRSEESLSDSVAKASQVAATRPEALRYKLNQDARDLGQQRNLGAMAIAYADSLVKSTTLPTTGQKLQFKSDLDLGCNAARYYNLADRHLDKSLRHITDLARSQSSRHIEEEKAVDNIIRDRVEQKLEAIYGPHDMKSAFETIKTALLAHREDLVRMADSIAQDVANQPEKPANPQFVAKLARDGALLRFALCEQDIDNGEIERAGRQYWLGDLMLLKARDLGYAKANVEQLSGIEAMLGMRLYDLKSSQGKPHHK